MSIKIILGILLGIPLFYYGLFKLKGKENRLYRMLVLTIVIASELIFLGKIFFAQTIFFPVAIFGGITIMFIIMTLVVWQDRRKPEKRVLANIYFALLGLLAVLAIAIFVLAKLGFFG